MRIKQLLIPVFALAAFLSSVAANAQNYDLYNNSAACDFDFRFTITDGINFSNTSLLTVTAGSTYNYVAPTGYWVVNLRVYDASGGMTDANVNNGTPNDNAGHCNVGTVPVVWNSPNDGQIN